MVLRLLFFYLLLLLVGCIGTGGYYSYKYPDYYKEITITEDYPEGITEMYPYEITRAYPYIERRYYLFQPYPFWWGFHLYWPSEIRLYYNPEVNIIKRGK